MLYMSSYIFYIPKLICISLGLTCTLNFSEKGEDVYRDDSTKDHRSYIGVGMAVYMQDNKLYKI